MPYLTRDESVFVLDLGEPGAVDTDNRFTPEWMAAVHDCLDEVEQTSGDIALVTTGTGKFYSNGFEPERFAGADVQEYLLNGQRLFSRILTLTVPTVAALNGHCFAAGAIFAAAHDVRIMRADRGFFCLPEIGLGFAMPGGLVIPGAMTDLLTTRLPAAAAHEAILTGRRYGGVDAAAAGIVDAAVPAEEVLPKAIEAAAARAGTRGAALGAMKQWMYRDVVRSLETLALSLDRTA
ncbi:enoyl-CoA hydratase/isomerase family protein [Nocardia cyriacigeorgica]|uniref:Enoyl-CoA hydratase/isomerase family protein n=1 Tax=Nocardia cyriacigeorgica TaxID=135487 RepID=A0A6P1CN54_9NOCA|nr:enoyl-CoA hydratase/isomerase family protein [Nocardia cyriacigeorgica]MBF6288336.1 enoyl-CoA hydratase/isomerase family protein [Nocardia cyriacigeorgica]NEW31615.1 enoyl-CoA hydratase/isomerase family protein [Nocardia cyriacigeorgica]BDT88813.1 enoyl-CoA hydratase [Nocardia cyriacigeorgica]